MENGGKPMEKPAKRLWSSLVVTRKSKSLVEGETFWGSKLSEWKPKHSKAASEFASFDPKKHPVSCFSV